MIFYGVVLVLLLLSFFSDRKKTLKALKIAWKRFTGILPAFVLMLVLVSISLYLLPHELVMKYLGEEDISRGMVIAMLAGSLTLMPGFIVFPLCGILREQGVPYMVLSAFTTTLMMVGVLTLPVEKQYFGIKTALVRNGAGLIIAVIVAVVTGLVFSEVVL
ncbi:MAG: hypothetical protein J7K88_10135 [Candidatus Fermentibacteraceae bacterium]|nr:hypothetical protein [Candidatus Fermentibacteraceae bacterium]